MYLKEEILKNSNSNYLQEQAEEERLFAMFCEEYNNNIEKFGKEKTNSLYLIEVGGGTATGETDKKGAGMLNEEAKLKQNTLAQWEKDIRDDEFANGTSAMPKKEKNMQAGEPPKLKQNNLAQWEKDKRDDEFANGTSAMPKKEKNIQVDPPKGMAAQAWGKITSFFSGIASSLKTSFDNGDMEKTARQIGPYAGVVGAGILTALILRAINKKRTKKLNAMEKAKEVEKEKELKAKITAVIAEKKKAKASK